MAHSIEGKSGRLAQLTTLHLAICIEIGSKPMSWNKYFVEMLSHPLGELRVVVFPVAKSLARQISSTTSWKVPRRKETPKAMLNIQLCWLIGDIHKTIMFGFCRTSHYIYTDIDFSLSAMAAHIQVDKFMR